MGIYVVFVYIQLYAAETAGVSSKLTVYLLAVINAGSSLGRVLPNFAAVYIGTLNMQVLFVSVAAALSEALLAIHASEGILAFCVRYKILHRYLCQLARADGHQYVAQLGLLGRTNEHGFHDGWDGTPCWDSGRRRDLGYGGW